MGLLSGIIIVIGIIIGLGTQLYFGDTPRERMAEEIIEEIVKIETGFDIEPILDIEDK